MIGGLLQSRTSDLFTCLEIICSLVQPTRSISASLSPAGPGTAARSPRDSRPFEASCRASRPAPRIRRDSRRKSRSASEPHPSARSRCWRLSVPPRATSIHAPTALLVIHAPEPGLAHVAVRCVDRKGGLRSFAAGKPRRPCSGKADIRIAVQCASGAETQGIGLNPGSACFGKGPSENRRGHACISAECPREVLLVLVA